MKTQKEAITQNILLNNTLQFLNTLYSSNNTLYNCAKINKDENSEIDSIDNNYNNNNNNYDKSINNKMIIFEESKQSKEYIIDNNNNNYKQMFIDNDIIYEEDDDNYDCLSTDEKNDNEGSIVVHQPNPKRPSIFVLEKIGNYGYNFNNGFEKTNTIMNYNLTHEFIMNDNAFINNLPSPILNNNLNNISPINVSSTNINYSSNIFISSSNCIRENRGHSQSIVYDP
jgi:hypothetical protein